MLKSINLAISTLCSANCVFCPSERGKELKNMPFKTAKKVIDEISTKEFQEKNILESISVSENGDALLNPELIKILEYIKSKRLNIMVVMYTNFYNFNKELIDKVLENNLIHSFSFNLDGYTKESYYLVKKIGLDRVLENLTYFIKKRKEINGNFPLVANILTLRDFASKIAHQFKSIPSKLKKEEIMNLEDEFRKIWGFLNNLLDLRKDNIRRLHPHAWTERNRIDLNNIDYSNCYCPMIPRVVCEVFIAPDGDWYSCCYDSSNDFVFGNINKNTIKEIYEGDKRKEFINNLMNKEFKKIGKPCNTVMCCM